MPRARLTTLSAVAALLACAGVATAQETPSQARARSATEALNQAPDGSVLGSDSSRPAPIPQPRPSTDPRGRTLTDVLNQTSGDVPVRQEPAPIQRAMPTRRANPIAPLGPITTKHAEQAPAAAAPAVAEPDVAAPPAADPVLADIPAGPPSALPPLPLGYYARSPKNCDQVWQGEGDLAWLSEIAFTIDFGGCDKGQIVQLDDTSWHEDQRCQTELGGNGGLFSIDYEAQAPATLVTRTRLGANPRVTEDVWTHCDADTVPAEARFSADDPGRAPPPPVG